MKKTFLILAFLAVALLATAQKQYYEVVGYQLSQDETVWLDKTYTLELDTDESILTFGNIAESVYYLVGKQEFEMVNGFKTVYSKAFDEDNIKCTITIIHSSKDGITYVIVNASYSNGEIYWYCLAREGPDGSRKI